CMQAPFRRGQATQAFARADFADSEARNCYAARRAKFLLPLHTAQPGREFLTNYRISPRCVSLVALSLALAGCGTFRSSDGARHPVPSPTPTGSPTPSPTPTGSPTPSPSPTDSPSPTPSPSPTDSPTPTPTPTPTAAPYGAVG